MGIHAAGQTNTFQVTIDRWSTNERQELFVALAETDQDGLIKALQIQEECGFLSMTGTRGPVMRRGSFPSQRIKYARDFRMDGKRRIVLDLDRPIPYWETVNRPRTYDSSIIVLDLDEEDEGQGIMAIGVRINLDTEAKQLEIENYSSEPVRLTVVSKSS